MARWISFLVMALLITGCAAFSSHYKGQRALDEGRYDEAIVLFQKTLETSPEDARAIGSIGVAYFKKGDLQKAAQYLERAKSVDPLYGTPYLYLGMVYEKQDDAQKAISEYNAYYRKFRVTPMARRLKARMGVLMRKQITREIQAAIKLEESLPVTDIPENTIAVSYFSNLSGDKELGIFQKGLAEMLILDLSLVESLRVLERTRVNVIMNELGLAISDFADPSQMPRVGKVLGARRIINGALAFPQKNQLRMDALVTNIATAETDAQAEVMGSQNRFFRMEKGLVFDILDDLKVELTQEERKAIQEQIPTESFPAFLAYCRGLDYQDRGMYREASQQYREAIRIDPGFSHASEKSEETQTLSDSPMTGSSSETTQLAEMASAEMTPESEQMVPSNKSMLGSTLQNTSGGFVASPDTGGQTDDRNPPQQQTKATVNVTVELE